MREHGGERRPVRPGQPDQGLGDVVGHPGALHQHPWRDPELGGDGREEADGVRGVVVGQGTARDRAGQHEPEPRDGVAAGADERRGRQGAELPRADQGDGVAHRVDPVPRAERARVDQVQHAHGELGVGADDLDHPGGVDLGRAEQPQELEALQLTGGELARGGGGVALEHRPLEQLDAERLAERDVDRAVDAFGDHGDAGAMRMLDGEPGQLGAAPEVHLGERHQREQGVLGAAGEVVRERQGDPGAAQPGEMVRGVGHLGERRGDLEHDPALDLRRWPPAHQEPGRGAHEQDAPAREGREVEVLERILGDGVEPLALVGLGERGMHDDVHRVPVHRPVGVHHRLALDGDVGRDGGRWGTWGARRGL